MQAYESYKKKDYTQVDYLINGMYVDSEMWKGGDKTAGREMERRLKACLTCFSFLFAYNTNLKCFQIYF